jgi:hypothetical protein
MFDFLNKDNYMLGFLCLNVDLMLDLVLHLKGFGKVAVDLAIHQERPTRVEGGAGHGDFVCSNCCCVSARREGGHCGVDVW